MHEKGGMKTRHKILFSSMPSRQAGRQPDAAGDGTDDVGTRMLNRE